MEAGEMDYTVAGFENRKKRRQIKIDDICLPFFLLFILRYRCTSISLSVFQYTQM